MSEKYKIFIRLNLSNRAGINARFGDYRRSVFLAEISFAESSLDAAEFV